MSADQPSPAPAPCDSPSECESQGGGIAIEVFAEANRGGRKHMEDVLTIELETGERGQAFVGILDGHGGKEAALYAKEHLWANIKSFQGFHTSDSDRVKEAIADGFKKTHQEMWTVRETWKRSKAGTMSTSGTTVSVSIIRKDRMFVANVGDSTMVLGRTLETHESTDVSMTPLSALVLSEDHKPEDVAERERIESIGGRVIMSAKGIMRVAWRRERTAGRGASSSSSSSSSSPLYDVVPFLSVARSLGDLWSYTAEHDSYYVSPVPDISEYLIDLKRDNFLIVASDGLWNVVTPQEAVDFVHSFRQDELQNGGEDRRANSMVANALIKEALRRWHRKSWSADNTSVMVVFFKELEPLPSDEQSEDGEKEEETRVPVTRMSSSDSGLPSDGADSPPVDSPTLIDTDALCATCDANCVRGSDVACSDFSSSSQHQPSTTDGNASSSEDVVAMETDYQRIRNKGKRKSTEMSTSWCDPSTASTTAPKRSKSNESLFSASLPLDPAPTLPCV